MLCIYVFIKNIAEFFANHHIRLHQCFSLELSWSGGISVCYLLSKRRVCVEFLNVNILSPLFAQPRCLPGIMHHSFSQDVPLKSLIVIGCVMLWLRIAAEEIILIFDVYSHNAWLPLVRLNVQRNDNVKWFCERIMSAWLNTKATHTAIFIQSRKKRKIDARAALLFSLVRKKNVTELFFFEKKKKRRRAFLFCLVSRVKYLKSDGLERSISRKYVASTAKPSLNLFA